MGTIEGLADEDGTLHPMQAAFRRNHGPQCGFCTPGMVMRAVELVESNPKLDAKAVRQGLEGNLCRCAGYPTSSPQCSMAPPRCAAEAGAVRRFAYHRPRTLAEAAGIAGRPRRKGISLQYLNS